MSKAICTNHRLYIESPLVNEAAVNYRLPSWPPPWDFPVVVDKDATVVSRYGDDVWDLSVWDRVPKVVNFGDGTVRKGAATISAMNANTFRMVAAWWLWGASAVRTASTFVSQHQLFRNLFALCSKEGIDARELRRFPVIIEKLATALPAARGRYALTLLHFLYEQRRELGFVILDTEGLRRLASCLPPAPEQQQTEYIPPRIWAYQVSRLRAVLEDFNHHAGRIEACYQAVLEAYASTYGSLLAARYSAVRLPIGGTKGTFNRLATEFGIDQLLWRWYSVEKKQFNGLPIFAFQNFLTLVTRAGLAYLLNFSLMRIQEAWSLPADCLHVEVDEKLGEVVMLCGETKKTVADNDARWITSQLTKVAVEALRTIGRWRLKLRESYGEILPATPALIQVPCEPWVRNGKDAKGRSGKTTYPSYSDVAEEHVKLFEPSELRITDEDWNLAKLITPTLSEESFGVGRLWSFGWHQLRRTGAVNMQASGLVSNFSLQYQLKHSILATSLYYSQGYSRLSFNQSAKSEYVSTMYELMGKELAQLFSDRFVSPYGAERKRAILQIVPENDHKKLVAAGKAGRVAWRTTLLGGCTKLGPCEYGGIDNIVRCGGGDYKGPCADALFDRDRLPMLERVAKMIEDRLRTAETGSPYQQSLEAQQRAVENAKHVITRK